MVGQAAKTEHYYLHERKPSHLTREHADAKQHIAYCRLYHKIEKHDDQENPGNVQVQYRMLDVSHCRHDVRIGLQNIPPRFFTVY